MKKNVRLVFAVIILGISTVLWATENQQKNCIVRYHEGNALFANDAKLKLVYTDEIFFEGPGWDPGTEKLYFVAWGDSKQFLRLDEPGKVTVCIDDPENKIGINGSFSIEGNRLLTAQVYAHKIVSYLVTANGLSNKKVLAEDADWFQPNDLCQNCRGDIYFSDPDWKGKKAGAVYLLKGDGHVEKIIDELVAPNGLIVSNDGKILYVADSLLKLWKSYPIKENGTVGQGRIFYKDDGMYDHSNPDDLPDGMTVDKKGNVYLTGLGGVRIVSPQGILLYMIHLPQKASNVTFGGKDMQTLYITCNHNVYALKMLTGGQ